MGAMRKAILMMLMAVLSGSATAEQYLCVPEKATGFAYDTKKNEWSVKEFNTDYKWIIASGKKGNVLGNPAFEEFSFAVTKVGEKDPLRYCKSAFNKVGFLSCGSFHFNRNNGRYLLSDSGGYWNVGKGLLMETDQASSTPYLEIGKCSPF